MKRGCLYVLWRASGGIVASAVVLLEKDSRWNDCPAGNAWYPRNFVADVSEKGTGGRLLDAVENLANVNGKRLLRLDCAADNKPLNAYYERRGYRTRGQCAEGNYTGIRREKTLEK